VGLISHFSLMIAFRPARSLVRPRGAASVSPGKNNVAPPPACPANFRMARDPPRARSDTSQIGA